MTVNVDGDALIGLRILLAVTVGDPEDDDLEGVNDEDDDEDDGVEEEEAAETESRPMTTESRAEGVEALKAKLLLSPPALSRRRVDAKKYCGVRTTTWSLDGSSSVV
jgi:hypothetical protein